MAKNFYKFITKFSHTNHPIEVYRHPLRPAGKLISLEIDPGYAHQAEKHFQDLEGKQFEIRIGHAIDSLAQLDQQSEGPFDLIFIDADKENNALYLQWALKLSRPGTLILIDNLIPKGETVGLCFQSSSRANL